MSIKMILSKKWLMMIILLGLFPPDYFRQFPALDIALLVLKTFVSVIVLVLFFLDIKRHIKKSFNVITFLLVAELLFMTLISKNASIYDWGMRMGQVFILTFLVEELMAYAPYNGLQCLYYYFSLITLINTVMVFIFPKAMYTNSAGAQVYWFLGMDNSAYIHYIFASTFAMLYCQYVSRKVTVIALADWISAFVFVFHNDIATGIACQLIWLLLVVIYRFKWLRKWLKAQYALYIMLAFFFFLVLSRKLILVPIVEALGRDVTLTGRTLVWDRTLALVLKKPLFGYGVCSGNVYANMIHLPAITMPHDWLLTLAFAGGFVAVALHILQVFLACREAWPFRDSPYYRFLVIGFIIVYIRSVTEGSFWPAYFMFPAMLCYSKEFLAGITTDTASKRRFLRKRPVIRFGGTIR